jgi:hypothetical protein
VIKPLPPRALIREGHLRLETERYLDKVRPCQSVKYVSAKRDAALMNLDSPVPQYRWLDEEETVVHLLLDT